MIFFMSFKYIFKIVFRVLICLLELPIIILFQTNIMFIIFNKPKILFVFISMFFKWHMSYVKLNVGFVFK